MHSLALLLAAIGIGFALYAFGAYLKLLSHLYRNIYARNKRIYKNPRHPLHKNLIHALRAAIGYVICVLLAILFGALANHK